jgi:branched-chain amino acid transport system permease protein
MTLSPRSVLLEALKIGLIGGGVAVFVSLVGMVEAFGGRDIVAGVISMGQTLLVALTLTIGFIAASRAGQAAGLNLASGALAGVLTGALLAALVWIGASINLRPIFVNASPALFEILTFGQPPGTATLLLLAVGALLGLIGAAIHLLPAYARGAVIAGLAWMALLGLLQDLIRVRLSDVPDVAQAVAWMFGRGGVKGLSAVGAVVVFVVISLANLVWALRGPGVRRSLQAMPEPGQRTLRLVVLAVAAVLLLALPTILGSYLSDVTDTVGLYILAGLGLNIVVGFAGLLDLGYVAFFAIGAYVMGVLTTTGGEISTAAQLTFWQALPIAVLASVVFGIVLGVPVLHIRGDYLAIVTLGFGEIIRILALSDFLKPHVGGSQGIVLVARGQLGSISFDDAESLYYLILAGCVLGVFVALRLKDSRLGRTWMALREDEDVAQAMGINLVATKLLAFGTGAAFSGLAGAIFASKLGTIYPHSFALLFSINVLALIIVGGMGSIPGVVIGAIALVGLPELLREFAEFRLLVYGAVLVAMMLLRPEGLWPEETRRRELHEAEPGSLAEPQPTTATAATD